MKPLDRSDPSSWPQYMTAKEVGKILCLGERCVQAWCKSGRLAFIPVGRRRLVRKAALIRHLERQEIKEV